MLIEKLLRELKGCNYIELSEIPDFPNNEEKYKVLDCLTEESIQGLTLFLKLEKISSNEKMTFSIPDILDIEKNDISDEDFSKWYLRCLSRKHYYEYKELEEMKSKGFKVDPKELQNNILKSNYTYRIIIKNT